MNLRALLVLWIGCWAVSFNLLAQAPDDDDPFNDSVAEITLRPSVRGNLSIDIQVWEAPKVRLALLRKSVFPCDWVSETEDDDYLSGTCRRYFASDGTLASGPLNVAPLVAVLHASGIYSVSVLMNDYDREIAQAPPGWVVETAEQRTKKYGRKRQADQSSGPSYWFTSDSGELPQSFELRMGTQWSAGAFLTPFGFTVFGPALLALGLRRRAERSGTTQAAAVWVHWILTATWLYWMFSPSASAISDLLAHLRIENLAATFILGSILMAAPPLFAVGACTAILLRDPKGETDARDTGDLVRRTVARQSVMMVPFAIFLGGAGSFATDWRLTTVALLTAFVAYRLLSSYVGRWIFQGAEILTHGELVEAASAMGARAGVTLSSVYVLGSTDEREVNAFAGQGGVIAVTRGLVQRMTRRELTAVIGHEVGHLRGKHIAMSTVAFWAYIVLSGPLTGVLLKYAHVPVWTLTLPLMPMAYIFGVTFLSRKNEFNADARAVDITGDPEAMIAALARLRKLTRTPVAWGGIQGSILSHPSMRDRVLALARHGGIPEERALALLDDPDVLEADAPSELRHFTLAPECSGKETIFSSDAKMSYLLWVGWAEQVSLVAFCVGVAVAAERWWPARPFGPLVMLAAMPLIAAAFLIGSNWIWRCFIRAVRRKLRRQMGTRAEGGTFAGLLPGSLAAPVEGFYQWDAGFFWLTPEALVYRGERTSFSLPRTSVRAISIVKGPLAWDRAKLVRVECESGALQLSRPDVGTMTHHARSLKRRLDEWQQGSGEAADVGVEPPPGANVMRPASTVWLRGWAALRLIAKRAFLLFLGVALIGQFLKGIHGLAFLPVIASVAYIVIHLPYFLRSKPQIEWAPIPEPAPVRTREASATD